VRQMLGSCPRVGNECAAPRSPRPAAGRANVRPRRRTTEILLPRRQCKGRHDFERCGCRVYALGGHGFEKIVNSELVFPDSKSNFSFCKFFGDNSVNFGELLL